MFFIKNVASHQQNYPTLLDQEQYVKKYGGIINIIFSKEGVNISNYNNNIFYLYDEIIKYQIRLLTLSSLYFDFNDVYNDILDEYLPKIIKSIKIDNDYYDYHSVIFIGPLNVTKVEKYFDLFQGNFDFYVAFDLNGCYWEKKNPPPLDFLDYEQIKDHWKNICIYSDDNSVQSMFHFTDDEIVKIKNIGPKELLIIAIVAVLIFVFILLTTLGILIYRYKKANINIKDE